MSKSQIQGGQRKSVTTTRDNIQGKLLGPNVKEINIDKFRELKPAGINYKLNGKLSENILKTISNKFSCDLIFNLDLSGQQLSTLDGMQECKNLMILNVQNNNLKELLPITQCTSITFLNISSNQISSLDALKTLKVLGNLHAEDNKISSMKGIRSLESCSLLQALSLQSLTAKEQNPICSTPNYREEVFALLPQLRRLDSVPKSIQFNNGSELNLGSKEPLSVDLSTPGSYYTPVFPKSTPFDKDLQFNLDGEETLKNSLKDCKTSIGQLEARMKALLAS